MIPKVHRVRTGMLIGYGDNNVLLIAIVEKEVLDLQAGRSLTYEGANMLTKDIIVIYGRDKPHVLEQLKAGGVKITEGQIADFLADRRTDTPRKPS